VRGIAPAFFGVVNVHRAGEHEEILGVHDHTIPCGQLDLLREGSRLRIPPVEIEDLQFQFAFHRLTRENPPRNPAMTLTGLPDVGLRAIADRSITMPLEIAWWESENASE
jgi:hypothetical protein